MRCHISLCLAFIAIAGCCSLNPRDWRAPPAVLSGNDEQIRNRLIQLIPVGTPLNEAEQIVQENGLSSQHSVNPKSGVPCLDCGYTDKRDFWVTWSWTIRIECPDERVTDIRCERFGTGP